MEGYRVQLAKTGREVIQYVLRQEPLELLIMDPDLRTRLSWCAWETARHAFSEENWKNTWAEVMESVISNNRHPSLQT